MNTLWQIAEVVLIFVEAKREKKKAMKKRNSIISGILLLLAITIASCGRQEQHYIEKMVNKMVKNKSPEEIEKTKVFTIDSLNFVELDSLGLTTDYINVWTKLYIDKSSTEDLVRDSKKLIDRLEKQSPKDIDVFIKAIANSTVLKEYPNVAASIVAYPYGVDVSSDEYSEIATRLFTSTRLPGNKAPRIEGLQPLEGVNSTLVLFYDGSCGICQHLLDELADNYNQLKAQGVRIVTISADGSKDTFEKNIEKYPWVDKLCDYQSFSGINFKRFGIAATPMMFLIDKNGIVTDQFSNLKDTGLIE